MKKKRSKSQYRLTLVSQEMDHTCGAACFKCVLVFFGRDPLDETTISQMLGIQKFGYTPPDSIVQQARRLKLTANLYRNSTLSFLKKKWNRKKLLIVTWWFEDSGHYSIVKEIKSRSIVLMDPWIAREKKWHQIELTEFEKYWKNRGSLLISICEKKAPSLKKTKP